MKTKILFIFCLLLFSGLRRAGATRLYVNVQSTAVTPDGLSWAGAYPGLTTAITTAASGDTIWVAAGTYQLSSGASYALKAGVAIFGGFIKDQISFSQRDWVTNKTILRANNRSVVTAGSTTGSGTILDGFTIMNGSATNGAGINMSSSSAQIRNCTLTLNNAANLGGGIYMTGSGSATIKNCIFLQNTATYRGGGLYSAAATAGWIIDSCQFTGNATLITPPVASVDGYGGGIYLSGSSPVITGCSFTSDSSFASGGAVFITGTSTPTLKRCTFTGNKTRTSFLPATPYGGGALFSDANTEWLMDSCNFIGNRSFGAGGAVQLKTSRPVITNCNFIQDTTMVYSGGAMYITGTAAPTLSHCTFTGNVDLDGHNGGGIYANTTAPAGWAIDTCTFTGNISYNAGGGMMLSGSSPKMTGCIFNNNKANASGAGLYVSATAAPALKRCTFNDNQAAYIGDTTAGIASYNKSGGGIYISSGTAVWTMDSCSFTNNKAANVRGAGGAVCIANSLTIITNCTFTGNQATGTLYPGNGGGAIHISGQKVPQISHCTFTGNYTDTYGGAVKHTGGANNGSPAIDTCLFTGNTSAGAGGGLYLEYSRSKVTGCQFINNSSVEDGGGLYIRSISSPAVNGCFFSGNTAIANGGGISNISSGEVTVTNCLMIRGTAGEGGGIYGSGPTRVINCTIYNNEATVAGGGISMAFPGQQSVVKNCIIYGNTAPADSSISGTIDDVSSNVIQNGYPGTGNAAVNPEFQNSALPTGPDSLFGTPDDGLQLTYCSPALDMGDNTVATATDILGRPRIINGTADQGAYEKQSTTSSGNRGNNVTLSNSPASILPFQPVCDDQGWTYYADPTNTDSLSFAINWGSGNNAAKNAASLYLVVNKNNKKATSAANGIWTMRRYWNADLHGLTLNSPVQIRFYYDPADTAAMHTSASATYPSATPGNIEWFKTTGSLFDTLEVAATGINNGNTIPLTPVYGTDNNVPYAQFNGITSFSGGTAALKVVNAIPLPVKLISFTAINDRDNNTVITKWKVAQEQLHFYEIERSTDAITFETAGTVTAAGKTDYQFTDHVPNTAQSSWYYRLKLVESNGGITYSSTVKLTLNNKEGNVIIAPNPARHEIVITNNRAALNGQHGFITDAMGTVVCDFVLAGRVTVNAGNWAAGIYLVKLPDGTVMKLVKE